VRAVLFKQSLWKYSSPVKRVDRRSAWKNIVFLFALPMQEIFIKEQYHGNSRGK
jgi:hypothetical protein